MRRIDLRLCATGVLIAASLAVGVAHPSASTARAASLPPDAAWLPLGPPIRGQQAGDRLGSTLATSSDGWTVVIGAPGDDTAGADAGRVQVLDWDGTSWHARGSAFTGAPGHRAGHHVAVSHDGDVVAFTASSASLLGGRVEVHRWRDGAWEAMGAPFVGTAGNPISLGVLSGDGDTVVLGRPLDDTTGVDGGSVEVYQWDGASWLQQGPTLRGATEDLLGFALDITPDGTTIAVGAVLGDHGLANSGNVTMYQWDGAAWVQRGPTLHGDFGLAWFGWAVALSDDASVLAVGAPGDRTGGFDAGRVFAYAWDGTTWLSLGTAITGTTNDLLGSSVAVDADGDTLAVSSPEFDAGANTDAGRVQVLDWDGTAWQQRSWAPEGDAAGDFASSMALSADGTTVAVGRLGDDINGAEAGSVQVYTSSVVRPWGTAVVGPVDFAKAGSATALDADGDTMAVGMPNLEAGPPIVGRVAVYRSIHGVWTPLGDPLSGDAPGDLFGAAVALDAAGDTIVVGAPRADDGADADAGQVQVYDWTGTVWQQRGGDLYGVLAQSDFGAAVDIDASGDVIVVGAPGTDLGGTDVGQATVWRWDGTAWQLRGVPVGGDQTGDRSGAAVAMSADASSIAVGDPYYELAAIIVAPPAQLEVAPAFVPNDTGRVRVFRWSGVQWQQRGTDISGASNDYMGSAVDLDATGDVVAVGSPGADITAPGANDGQVSVFAWTGAAWATQGGTLNGEAVDDRAGTSVAISSDGLLVAVGAPRNDSGGADAGHTRLYRFQGSSWRQLADLDGLTAGEQAGSATAVSGDGMVAMVGSPERLTLRPANGAATVYRVSRRSSPARAASVAVQAAGPDRLSLSWTQRPADPLDPVSASQIQISTDGGVTWAPATWTTTDPAGTTLTGLAATTPYRVRVRDVNSTGSGPWHTSASVTTGGWPLPTPTAARRVTTITGDDPYSLAVAVSQQAFASTVDTVHVVTGDTFPDAIAGGVVAGIAHGPVLLTRPDQLPESTRAELRRLAPRRIVIVGGPHAVSEQVAEELADLTPTLTRLGGPDRYATAASVAGALAQPGLDVVYVVNGTIHDDGTVVAPWAAAAAAPVLLVTKTTVPAATRQALEQLAPRLVVVVGGRDAVADRVVEELAGLASRVERVAGDDLGATAVALAQHGRATTSAPVIVVNRRRPGDGLALAPLAVLNGSPVLVSDGGCTTASVMDEISRRDADVVVVTTDMPERAVASLDTICQR